MPAKFKRIAVLTATSLGTWVIYAAPPQSDTTAHASVRPASPPSHVTSQQQRPAPAHVKHGPLIRP